LNTASIYRFAQGMRETINQPHVPLSVFLPKISIENWRGISRKGKEYVSACLFPILLNETIVTVVSGKLSSSPALL